MADSNSGSGGGFFAKLTFILLFVLVCALGVAGYFVMQPQDLTGIGGFAPVADAAPPRDLKLVLETAVKRGFPVTLTETEINHWIAQTLTANQGGVGAGKVSLEKVLVCLTDDQVEVVMERKVFGRPFTVSMFLKVAQVQEDGNVRTEVHYHGGPYHGSTPNILRGGRFGRLVVPQGFLLLVMPAYKKLAEVYQHEMHLAFAEMVRIRIEPKRLVLESREPEPNDTAGQIQTF